MASSAPLKQEYALNRNICQLHCICKIHGCTSFSGVSIVDFENVNACLGREGSKKFKYEEMLYLISLKREDFLNSYIFTSSYSTYLLHCKLVMKKIFRFLLTFSHQLVLLVGISGKTAPLIPDFYLSCN